MLSPFGDAAVQSPYPSPAHPFSQRTPHRRRPACEDVLFFDVPVSEVCSPCICTVGKACWEDQCCNTTLLTESDEKTVRLQVEKVASGNGHVIGGDPEWTSASQVCPFLQLGVT